ncbi:hypothetical protein EHQ53_17180 [Leptospira langatensis]|uniref:Glycosyltransferase RgtA/B/C/D-like domain-containing protein n=1 Tax=Leptospira langatensis TaxID=2484983 RepID=A0A5F1ZNX1_9LEPT|nr:hypothetical protein [Leptospira langatensis]TGK05369.1 hypothetical protein EHO57_01420 [Leptospira langatensis]TGL38505.1 hypothetical protein EHQ53_17180 [Leptospira langatensis]
MRSVFLPILCALFIGLFVSKMDPNAILVSDNQNKIFQAQAFLDSGFKSQYASCEILRDLGACTYFPSWQIQMKHGISGPFPVAFSLFAAVVGWLADYSYLFYIAIFFFILGVSILKIRNRINSLGILVLVFGPVFFHSVLFPDYSISFLCTCIAVSAYRKPREDRLEQIFLGLLAGLGFFFRPENSILLFFLGIIHIVEWIKLGLPKKDSEEAKRFLLLVGSGVSILFYGILNFYLYDSPWGSRIYVNATVARDHGALKYVSLLFAGHGRVGFLFFCPWIALGAVLLFLKWRSLEKTEKFLLSASILSLGAGVLMTPNDSNIDWGTRYLSWLCVPAVVLFFSGNSKRILESFPKAVRWVGVLSFLVSLFFSKVYYVTEIAQSKEMIRYNQFFRSLPEGVNVSTRNTITALYGQDIFHKKVMIVREKGEYSKLVNLLLEKNENVNLIRYNSAILSKLRSMPKAKESGQDAELEKLFLSRGWKISQETSLEKIEVLHLTR